MTYIPQAPKPDVAKAKYTPLFPTREKTAPVDPKTGERTGPFESFTPRDTPRMTHPSKAEFNLVLIKPTPETIEQIRKGDQNTAVLATPGLSLTMQTVKKTLLAVEVPVDPSAKPSRPPESFFVDENDKRVIVRGFTPTWNSNGDGWMTLDGKGEPIIFEDRADEMIRRSTSDYGEEMSTELWRSLYRKEPSDKFVLPEDLPGASLPENKASETSPLTLAGQIEELADKTRQQREERATAHQKAVMDLIRGEWG